MCLTIPVLIPQPVAGEVVISEFFAATSEANQFVEIYNPTDTSIDLTGYVISNVTSGLPAGTIGNSTIEAGGFAVLFNGDSSSVSIQNSNWLNGQNRVPSINWVSVTNFGELDDAPGDRVGIWDSLASFNGGDFTSAIDEVNYSTGIPWPSSNSGFSQELIADNLDNNIGTAWRTSSASGPAGWGASNIFGRASPGFGGPNFVTAIPEPSSLFLVSSIAIGVVTMRRRR